MAAVVLASISCERPPNPGTLRINAPSEGTYDIYKIASESPLQYVSERVGRFNSDIALDPGSYLVMADCSSESVLIYPGQRETLTAHDIRFEPPRKPTEESEFSIQCDRSQKARFRQNISRRYKLSVLHGKREILVSMVPLHIDFTAKKNPRKPKTITYELSALQVGSGGKLRYPDASFFVSPTNELVTITESQTFGNWDFLLPGPYKVQVNGTSMSVDLKKGEERVIQPASLEITTPKGVELERSLEVTGRPHLVEINDRHWLNFNETYPVLPGQAKLKISGSSRIHQVQLQEDETTRVKTNSIRVDLGCSPWEWTCLGDNEIALYLEKRPYPFIESITDIPVLYVPAEKPVWLGIGGSRDIRYKLSPDRRAHSLQVGYVKLRPRPSAGTGSVTDLVRVETPRPPLLGHSLDVNLSHGTRMPLVPGTYSLAHYVSLTHTEGQRQRTTRRFSVAPGETTELSFRVYFAPEKYKAWKARRKKKKRITRRRERHYRREFDFL